MHRITDVRLSGISRRNFRMFHSLCGDTTLHSVAIVTNMWSLVPVNVGSDRERQLSSDPDLFKPAVDAGARMMQHRDTVESAQAILNMLVANVPVPLRIQQEIVAEHKAVTQNAAQAEIDNEEMQKARKQQEQAERVRREAAAAALAEQQAQRTRALEQERQKAAAEAARARQWRWR